MMRIKALSDRGEMGDNRGLKVGSRLSGVPSPWFLAHETDYDPSFLCCEPRLSRLILGNSFLASGYVRQI